MRLVTNKLTCMKSVRVYYTVNYLLWIVDGFIEIEQNKARGVQNVSMQMFQKQDHALTNQAQLIKTHKITSN